MIQSWTEKSLTLSARKASEAIERLLFLRALDAADTTDRTMTSELKIRPAFVGLAILGVGVGIVWLFPTGILNGLGVAVFIAGILAITVDPFLKKQITHEASKDIFHHLLGFGLPTEIKERLKEIVNETKLYRRNMTMTCLLSETDMGIRVEFETRFEIVNPTSSTLPFRQKLSFEKAERAALKSISMSGNPRYGKGAKLESLKGVGLGLGYEGTTIKIKPEKSNEHYWFSSEYSCEYSSKLDFHALNFGYPTVGFTLKLREKPDNLFVSAGEATKQTENEWVYEQLFMPGDHIQIRWEPLVPEEAK